ncbi:MAG: diguanylate cyclase [Telluria sp.]
MSSLLNPAAVRVLIVDDQPIVLEQLRRMLTGLDNMDVCFVTESAQALEAALAFRPTVILQDMIMPGISGMDLIRHYREQPALAAVPVIVLSAIDTPAVKGSCFEIGANDYLIKVPDRIELLARIRYHSAAYVKGIERDEAFDLLKVSQQQLADANFHLQKLTGQDGLTGIANRRRFDEVMRTEWQRGCRTGQPLSLLMCDVDHFKRYNDSFGHLAGDLCLQRVAAVLTGNLKRPGDLAARYGGEEFALVLPDTDARGAMAVAQGCRSYLENLAIPASDSDAASVVTMSVGVATMRPTSAAEADSLLREADRALYSAKQGGRNRVAAGRSDGQS